MNGKLRIIGIIIMGGFFLLLFDYLNLIPEAPDVADTIKQDLTDFTKKTGDDLDDAMDNSLSLVNEKIDDLEEGIFFGKIKEEKPVETQPSNEKGFGGDGGGGGSSSESNVKTNSPTKPSPKLPTKPKIIQTPVIDEIPFDTLSLITKKQSDDNVIMKYEDTSGETISVTVIIRNEEKILFTGQFFSSSFETIILDASDTPHFINLVVEHAIQGQIIATAFNPAGNTDTSIYGVFSKK